MRVSLISHDSWTRQREVIVDKLPAVLGRDLDSDVRLEDCWVSRAHCWIDQVDGTLVVRDLESTNGTLVNGKSVVDSPLLPGDTLTIGITRFEVHYELESPNASASSESGGASQCCIKQNTAPEHSTHPRPTIGDCSHWLDQLGWSVAGPTRRHPKGSDGWQLDAIRGDHTIVARAVTQTDAWLLACRIAIQMERAA
jgi:predicted component of type VI protein secretion system